LSHYEIVSSLGAGGMGEVYRARDTKLGREVAIKLLLEEVSSDPDRLARFQREARVLASLNHANIATLHGLEDHQGTSFLVMELVEGDTLADRIARGPLPIDEALPLFVQIAEGLAAAHDKGVIHRDLKPANIKIDPESGAKILDFGLAKALTTETESTDTGLSHSPTLTLEATQRGQILGTAAYMAPEQAKGTTVDQRADLWALGCCLYEALAAQRVFSGESAPEVLASVLKDDVDWSRLPASTPSSVRRLLRRTLQKDRALRLHSAADARLELLEPPGEQTGPGRPTPTTRRSFGPLVAGAAVAAVFAGAAVRYLTPSEGEPPSALRVTLDTPPGIELPYTETPSIAISADGERLAYVGSQEGTLRLVVQELDGTGETTVLDGTEDASHPTFSPDGGRVAFGARGAIHRADIQGGRPVQLVEVSELTRGLHWAVDDYVYYTPDVFSGVWRVHSSGGEPAAVTEPEASDKSLAHFWPYLLPDRRTLLYVECCSTRTIVARDLQTGRTQRIVEDATGPAHGPFGHLLYTRGSSLLAATYDREAGSIDDERVVLAHLMAGGDWSAHYSLAATGHLAYIDGAPLTEWILEQVTRDGTRSAVESQAAGFMAGMRISPDGTRLAFDGYDGTQQDIYVLDLATGGLDQITDHPSNDFAPVWTPDGDSLVFTSLRESAFDLWLQPIDRSEPPRLVVRTHGQKWPMAVTPDGQTVLFREGGETARILAQDLAAAAEPTILVAGQADHYWADVSPDGRWIAYSSRERGLQDVFVQPYEGGGRCRISTQGGDVPRWAAGGSQLFFTTGKAFSPTATTPAIVVADLDRENPCEVQQLRTFSDGYISPWLWDVSDDGARVVAAVPPEPASLELILNWTTLLEGPSGAP
jgi:serine/threonine protein kinase